MQKEPREPHEPRQPIPQPPPVSAPQPTRLGNPSVSNMIEFTFGEQTTMLPNIPMPEPFPPIPNGEDTTLLLTPGKTSYQWGDTAVLIADLLFKNGDQAGLPNRPVGFNVDGETFLVKTNSDGVARLFWKPFGVPAPGQPAKVIRAYAFFLGY